MPLRICICACRNGAKARAPICCYLGVAGGFEALLMFYDLNLAGDTGDAFLQRERVTMAVRLGFDCLATNHQASDRLTEQDRCWDGACIGMVTYGN